jgi:phospholipid-binding lipoprotein MlaA
MIRNHANVRGRLRRPIAWILPLLLCACAEVPRDASLPVNDPHEAMNRHVMASNQAVLRPASVAIRAVIPGPVHDRLHDLNSNLKEPRIFVNNLLQARLNAAARSGARLFLNSTFGLGGLLDVAGREGLQQESGDFGQTLFVWGVADGPYIVRPYLGPSTLRDAVGSTVDMVANPLGWLLGSGVVVTVSTTALDAADRLGQLKQAEDASIDFYSFVRSSYYQMRRAELREGAGLPSVIDSPALTDLDDPEPTPAPVATRSAAAAR